MSGFEHRRTKAVWAQLQTLDGRHSLRRGMPFHGPTKMILLTTFGIVARQLVYAPVCTGRFSSTDWRYVRMRRRVFMTALEAATTGVMPHTTGRLRSGGGMLCCSFVALL